MKKQISIVLATYNGEKYLREQLDSLYNQTLKADEVIAIDDCSSDHTIDILKEYQLKYGLKYLRNESNLGVNANFEKGLKLCQGDYICFCDQDDVWFPRKNEILYAKMQEIENDGPCIVSSRNTFVDENLNVHHNTELKQDTSDYRDTILYHLSQGASMMMNRKCLDFIFPFPGKDSKICYDYHVGYIVAMVGEKYDLKQSLMYYRVHGDNVTAQLEVKKAKSPLVRKRPTGVVPLHFVNTFIYAYPYVRDKALPERLKYVENIVRLSQDIGLIEQVMLLCSTPHIPVKMKVHSFIRALANFIFLQK